MMNLIPTLTLLLVLYKGINLCFFFLFLSFFKDNTFEHKLSAWGVVIKTSLVHIQLNNNSQIFVSF